jgi:hypothetical protein
MKLETSLRLEQQLGIVAEEKLSMTTPATPLSFAYSMNPMVLTGHIIASKDA